ncbi:MAG: cell division protein SepF [Candidatus Bathyarchaeota archaeon]|nr:cell division protein SepF [Candidatus Termiticorpusculum sp.]
MPAFGLFRKQKKQNPPEQTAENIQESKQEQTEEVAQDALVEENAPEEPKLVLSENQPTVEPVSFEPAVVVESSEPDIPVPAVVCKTYLKAMPLRDPSDIEDIKIEVQNGNILILRITPLASKSIESVKSAVNELYAFTESIGGDIARLGEERVVICPKNIRIWREKAPVENESLPTTAA